MDNKNLIAALSLSMSVLLFWSIFFESTKTNSKKFFATNKEKNDNIITPNINESLKIKKFLEKIPINNSKRLKIENSSIIGSLSLKGGLIDDISFKKHKQNLKNNKNS